MKQKWPVRFDINYFIFYSLLSFILNTQELEMTGEDDEVYKKVGNVLFPQNRQETIQILSKEESYINAELFAPLFHYRWAFSVEIVLQRQLKGWKHSLRRHSKPFPMSFLQRRRKINNIFFCLFNVHHSQNRSLPYFDSYSA